MPPNIANGSETQERLDSPEPAAKSRAARPRGSDNPHFYDIISSIVSFPHVTFPNFPLFFFISIISALNKFLNTPAIPPFPPPRAILLIIMNLCTVNFNDVFLVLCPVY